MSCPYSKITNNKVSSSNETTKISKREEEDILSVKLSEKDHSENRKTNKCPYSTSQLKENKAENKEKSPLQTKNNSDDEEEEAKGGCPIKNIKTTDPENKLYTRSWELPYYGAFDFMFEMRGLLSNREFQEKTCKLRGFNRHLLYTLFNQKDENLNKVREKEFPMVFFIYDDIKVKGNKFFKKGLFKEALDHYFYAYSTLKWLEHKDKDKGKKFLVEPSLDPVLDEEIEEKSIFLDAPHVEEDSYKACIVNVLLNMTAVYMEKRNFREAMRCMNEASELSEDYVPDVFFRRSQVRAYNKSSTMEDLIVAMEDIDKAMKSLEVYNERNKDNYLSKNNKKEVFLKYREDLKMIIESKINDDNEKEKRLIESTMKSYELLKKKNLKIENCFFLNGKDQLRQMKILNEMRNKYFYAIKFFTETKNDGQMSILYKEIEVFLDLYSNFKYYAEFDVVNINPKALILLNNSSTSQENQSNPVSLLENEEYITILNDFKWRACDELFSNSNSSMNFELFKYACEKIFDDERKEREAEEEKEKKNKKPLFFELKNRIFMKFQLFSTGKDNINWVFVGMTLILLVFTLMYMNNKIVRTSNDFK